MHAVSFELRTLPSTYSKGEEVPCELEFIGVFEPNLERKELRSVISEVDIS
jgi:hypothetical protein